MKKFKVAGLQVGAYPGTYEKNWSILSRKTEDLIIRETPYLIAYSELMAVPYFAGVINDDFFSYAETMDGPTVNRLTEMSLTFGVHLIGTLFEKAEENGQTNYYNTAFVCSPTRGLIGKYRKVHLPKIDNATLKTDEKYYFEQFGGGGTEFPTFTLDNGMKIGILICFDRSFPEAWKALTLQDVDLVVVPTATYGFRKDLYVQELQIRAMENNVFVLGINKTGVEHMDGEALERNYFGYSCLIDPYGEVIDVAGDDEWSNVIGEVDLSLLGESKERVDWNRERKTDVYKNYLTNVLA